MAEASAQAASAEARAGSGELVAGPFDVGNIGQVAVVRRELGEQKYLYAQFTGTGRPSRIPLAAVAVLSEKLD